MSNCRVLLLALTLLVAGCQQQTETADVPLGPADAVRADAVRGPADAVRGQTLVSKYGCGGCHVIPGIGNARGVMGPSLAGIANRPELEGGLTNEPANMVRWILDPKSVNPVTFMPDLNMSEQDAHDIAAFLYTLK